MEDWKLEALQQAFSDSFDATEWKRRCSVVNFISGSSGRRIIERKRFNAQTQIWLKRIDGDSVLVRRKRRAREISFLKVKIGNGRAVFYPIVRGEIRNARHDQLDIDAHVQEILRDLPHESRTKDHLLTLIEQAERSKQKIEKIGARRSRRKTKM